MSSKPRKASLDSAKVLIEFFDSIPEYDDVNHLSNTEFYKKIELLKEKQRSYFNNVENDYAMMMMKSGEKSNRLDDEINDNSINVSPKSEISSMKDTITQPPSRRSVRIKETPSPPSQRIKSAQFDNHTDNHENRDFDSDNLELLYSKSAPASPVKQPNGITIPKPFQMTVRDEENHIIDDLLVDTKKSKKDQQQMFKANPVPIESRIPLFDKIMLDQQIQSHAIRERRKAELQAQIRPFSFTKRDEFLQDLKRELSKSSPSLYSNPEKNRNKRFKAKPIPKHLFSNYFYRKMYDNGFYRALQKKIRSEEMLKAASLPPSMAKREQNELRYDVCPKLYKSLNTHKEETCKKTKRKNEEILNHLLSSKNSASNKSESPLNSVDVKLSNLDLLSGSRSNLAAVLRIQSARKRLEMEMCRKLDELQLKEESRWREKLMRKKPIWQTINYDNEEDIDMRLEMRRYEDRLRRDEHRKYMETMYGRVSKQPTLFERQSRNYAKHPV